MKKLMLSILLLVCCCNLYAQNPTYTDKLFYTCKLYGFVKYYHSEVSTCKVKWDSVLIDRLPAVKAAVTKDDFNDVLIEMLNAAGPMAPAVTPLPDTLPARLKRNRNWGWTNDPLLRSDVSAVLNDIKTNFVPHDICWIKKADASISGYWDFSADTNYVYDIDINFPSEPGRLLTLFKYWNILNYFYPYNNGLDVSLDNTFQRLALMVSDAPNSTTLKSAFVQLSASLKDVHLENSSLIYPTVNNYYYLPSFTRYASGKYIAVKKYGKISVGDELINIDGVTMQQWEDSLRPYISAGNDIVFRREMNIKMLAGKRGSIASINYKDSTGSIQNLTATRINQYPNLPPLPISMNTINEKLKIFSCGIVYLDPSLISAEGFDDMYDDIKDYPYLVIDLRKSTEYPIMYKICEHLYSQETVMVKYDFPDTTYPGTFYNFTNVTGTNNVNAYRGKVVILTYEDNQSRSEFFTMLFQQLSNAITIGTQTAGTDGTISIADNIIKNYDFHFTSTGIFYPNGDSTQRIGVGPRKPGDVLVQLTQEGIRHGRDEILEAALKAAGCPLTTEEIQKVMSDDIIYPNPATNTFTIQTVNNNNAVIKVYSLTGQLILETTETQNINIAALPAGIYLVQVVNGGTISTTRLKKE